MIYHGDCIEIMKNKINDKSINLVITSPPYNVNLKYNSYNDNKEYNDYLNWLKTIFEIVYKKLTNDGRLCINIGDQKNGKIPTHAYLINVLTKELKYNYFSTIIWNKKQIHSRTAWGSFKSPSKPSFPTPFEYILIFSKNDGKLEHKGKSDITKQEFIDFSLSLWNISPSKQMKKFNHPAIFPEEIPYRLIKKDKEKTLEYVDNLTVLSKSASNNIKETLAQMGKKDEYIHVIQQAMNRKDSINLALGFKLKSVLKDGFNDKDIQVNVEKTVVYISIADKLLFKSGSATISSAAKNILGKVAEVVNAQPNVEVMVEGYTDNKPISTAGIKDNWDLSVKRSTAVVRVLQNDYNIEPSRLIAAGRSEYKPLESNDTVEGRARNRRTRIILMPKLDQFFKILENKVGQ